MRILQISYYYPPMGGAGVQRALKFSRYLPEFGVQPVVLAAHDRQYQADASLLAELPAGLEVLRIEDRPLLQRLLAVHRRMRSNEARPAVSAMPDVNASAVVRAGADAAVPPAGHHARPGFWRDRALAAYAVLQFPDDRAGWARRALRAARPLLESGGIDLVFSSAPPVSAHALARRLAREYRLPWVADFRDLWTDNPEYCMPAWRRRLDVRSEGRWLREADGIVTVTPSWQRWLASRTDRPVAFIPNGYDEADFAGLAPTPRTDGTFRLVHTGTFYGHRSPLPVLRGVSAYLTRADRAAPPLRLRLVGSIGGRFESLLCQFEADHPGVLERVPYRPHREALADLLAADALLLVVGGASGMAAGTAGAGALPGKLFEYLRAQRPVLLVGPEEGDAAALLRRHADTQIVDEGSPERIAEALTVLVRRAATGARRESPADFERRALAGRLAQFLRQCSAARHG